MRFVEFQENWLEYKLKEITNIYDGTHQTPNYTDNGIPFVSVEDIKSLESTNKFISSADFLSEFKVYPKKGDILMTRIGDIGTPSIVNTDYPIAYYVSLALLKAKKGITAGYLNFYIQSPCFQHELWKRTIHVAFPRKINKNEIGECTALTPSKAEQEKIANFLTLIDERIATQNKIIDKLESLIKGIRAKVFTRKAENYKRLKDLYIKGKAGGTPKSTINEYYDGEIPFLSIADISSQSKYITKTERYLSESGIENSSAWKVPENSLILSIYASVGLPCINKIELSTSQAMFAMVLEDEQMLNYLYHYLLFYKDTTLIKYLATGTQSNINADIVKEIKIPLYGVDTISKIDKLLQFSDEKIEQEKNMLLTLQRQKAYLLKNMFI